MTLSLKTDVKYVVSCAYHEVFLQLSIDNAICIYYLLSLLENSKENSNKTVFTNEACLPV